MHFSLKSLVRSSGPRGLTNDFAGLKMFFESPSASTAWANPLAFSTVSKTKFMDAKGRD